MASQYLMTLRDLLTQNIPGNPLTNMPLGDATDPQFNRFSFNVIGRLGPSPGVDTGMPTIFAGPYNVPFGGGFQQPMQPKMPKFGPAMAAPMPMGQTEDRPHGGSFMRPIGNATGLPGNFAIRNIGNPGAESWTPWGSQPRGVDFGGGFSQMFGSGLKNSMLGWKF